jgi:glycosyltransferase involved in cell wall biosynthesis
MQRAQNRDGERAAFAPTSDSVAHDAPSERSYRVLMIAPTSFFADYGCHVRILEEARVLQKMGHRVTIATYRNGRNLPDLDIRRTLPIPWRTHYEVGSSRHKIAFDALLGLRTGGLLLRHRYDIIHAHLHEGALIGLTLGKLFRLPVVFDFQGSLTEEMIDHKFLRRESVFYRPLRRLETWIDHTASVVFTSSGHAERVLVEQFGCSEEKIRILPDCVNTDVFRPAAQHDSDELATLRRQLGIPEGAKLIVYLGLLAEYQGTGLLLDAVQRILQQGRDVYLLLMGFPGVQIYRHRAEALGIQQRVIFTGRVAYEDAPKHLALGDVAAAPKQSLTESSGKLLNYMATALPTVAFDTPVAREYLGADGAFAVPGDVESLAQKLIECLFPADGDRQRVIETGQRLRRRAIQNFEWREAGHEIVDAYQRLLERPKKGNAPYSPAASRR